MFGISLELGDWNLVLLAQPVPYKLMQLAAMLSLEFRCLGFLWSLEFGIWCFWRSQRPTN
jgi:hypothetical protein